MDELTSDLFVKFAEWMLENVPRRVHIDLEATQSKPMPHTIEYLWETTMGLKDEPCDWTMDELEQIEREAKEYDQGMTLTEFLSDVHELE